MVNINFIMRGNFMTMKELTSKVEEEWNEKGIKCQRSKNWYWTSGIYHRRVGY